MVLREREVEEVEVKVKVEVRRKAGFYCRRLDTLPCPTVAQTTDTVEGDLQIDLLRRKRDLPCPTVAQTTAAYERESGLALAVFVQMLEHWGG